MQYVVTTRSGGLNLRSGPGTGYRVVGTLKNGDSVDIASIQSKWAKLSGKTQYAHADFLVRAAQPTGPRKRPLPDGRLMWQGYPVDTPEAVKRAIGGAVDASWITNTCVVRLSAALNSAGHPVPKAAPGLTTVVGGDGKNYALRVREMRRYLEDTYGPPTYVFAGPAARAGVAGKHGIILFEVAGWSNSNGHVDMWNGRTARYGKYFEEATEVLLWAY